MKDKNKISKIYYDEVGREDVLDRKIEQVLSELIKKGDEKAVSRLATANLRFVMHMAKKYEGRGVETEDLVSEGNIELVKAARRYDASHGRRFIAYAAPYIDKAMRRIVDKQVAFVSGSGKPVVPTKKHPRVLSVDAPLGGMENLNLLGVLPDEHSPQPDTTIRSVENSEHLKQLMHLLNEREREVIVRIYGLGCDPKTMAAIGEEMGLKRERVRQIRNKALRKMSK